MAELNAMPKPSQDPAGENPLTYTPIHGTKDWCTHIWLCIIYFAVGGIICIWLWPLMVGVMVL